MSANNEEDIAVTDYKTLRDLIFPSTDWGGEIVVVE
jgi:hypothetical protein